MEFLGYVTNIREHARCRFWILWNTKIVKMTILHMAAQCIHFKAEIQDFHLVVMIIIYGFTKMGSDMFCGGI